MNVNEIINIIKEVALEQPIESVYDGDVYEMWNSAEAKYGSVNIGLQSMTYNDQNITYTFVLYYGDRLMQDKTNANSIYTDGIRILQSILNTLSEKHDIIVQDSIIYTPFQQKFMDFLAGVYVQVDLTTDSELGLCGISDFGELEDDDNPILPDFPKPDLPDKPIIPDNPFHPH